MGYLFMGVFSPSDSVSQGPLTSGAGGLSFVLKKGPPEKNAKSGKKGFTRRADFSKQELFLITKALDAATIKENFP